MSLVASPLVPPRAAAAPGAASGSDAVPSTVRSAGARGFVELDDAMSRGVGGVVLVRVPSPGAAYAIGAHVARRARAAGLCAIEASAHAGAPLWREVASRLGVGALGSDPREAARAVAHAAALRRAVVVAALPAAGGWDRAVACELASATITAADALARPDAPLLAVLVTTALDEGDDVCAEPYEVSAALDAVERQRWFAALAEAASAEVTAEDLATLDAWWDSARRASPRSAATEGPLPPEAERLLAALAAVSRSWPLADLSALGADDGALRALVRCAAVRDAGGWVAPTAAWQPRADRLAEAAGHDLLALAAGALRTRFEHDPWAQARVAELLVRAGDSASAEDAHTRALALADDSLAHREIVARWMTAVSTLPREAQLPLRARAAERALVLGQAEEAYRWAQSAAALAPRDPAVTLLFGRTAVSLGDLVAAKVALERGGQHARDDATRAVIAAELAEAAYLGGDLAAARREAERALSLQPGDATRLKARNTIGKLLLAASSWDEADRHFAEDAWIAAGAGLRTEELRARLNRGIALLSKGGVDEARAIFEAVLGEGERAGDARACAFALENLYVVATMRHEYAHALALAERTLKLRQRIGDRVATARLLGNLAELRRRVGLLDHAEHAVAFGRRALGPGMPPARASHFSLQAARNALVRGNTVEARREAARALADSDAAGVRHYSADAYCVLTRAALEDGDLPRAGELLERGRSLATTDALRAEAALLAARHARAAGEDADALAAEALAAARASSEEDLIIEAHVLLAEIHRASGRLEAARAHVEHAAALRDQIAATLPDDVRGAFLSRPDLVSLARLQAIREPLSCADLAPQSQSQPRSSSRPPAGAPRELVGDDPAIRGLLTAVRKVARSSSTVLVRGESGTGKELVAEAIHRASERAAGPLVTVNCAALVETLLLSELFGHEKGAFTGAIARRRGRFELAEGGTLFLDEIGDISPRTQVALLRVLQERTFERVGGTAPIRANVRVICATHRDLKAMVERGEFREDLYYRLRGITLEVPPLRARMGDLPRISDHLLARIAIERGEAKKTLSSDAVDLLGRHRWPGNVRELENALRAASLFADGSIITAATLVENVDDLRAVAAGPRARPSLPPPVLASVDAPQAGGADVVGGDDDGEAGPLPLSEASATAVAYTQVRAGGTSLPDIKRQIERDCIARALAETKGNITRAAALLGMKRPRLSQLVKQYGLAAVSSEGS